MFNRDELDCLIAAMRENGVTTLDVKHKQQRLRLVLPAGVSVAPPYITAPDATSYTATSPTIGSFLQRGIDDGLAPLEAGAHVTNGEVLGYVCHGPVRTVVNAPVSGVLSDQGPAQGTALGRGDTVFTMELTS